MADVDRVHVHAEQILERRACAAVADLGREAGGVGFDEAGDTDLLDSIILTENVGMN